LAAFDEDQFGDDKVCGRGFRRAAENRTRTACAPCGGRIVPVETDPKVNMKLKWQHMAVAIAGLALTVPGARSQTETAIPHLKKHGTATQLIVDGQPFLVRAAELNNSSASSLAYLKPLWPRLAATHLNTVLATVSWELIEPEEGKFDFKLVDDLLQEARANDLHLVILWFGSWKNGKSTYQPLWVKNDQARFPLAASEDGKSMPILTTLSDANRDADARAFAALMRHLRKTDGRQHTVLMIQVENEVGVLGDTRDYSPAANQAFAGPVPKELMDYLMAHKDTLVPELRDVWATNGFKTAGTWTEVFGPGKPAGKAIPVRTLAPPLTEQEHETGWRNLHWPVDEMFMAWNYARYVGYVVAAGKAEYNIPMYVNAWLQQRDHAWPGTYPSGGPVPQVHDLWQAGAPAIDILAPDLYVPEFEELCGRFIRSGNPLFIPESGAGARGVANAIWAYGSANAIGYSPFGIDRLAASDLELANGYAAIAPIAPLILAHQGDGTMTSVLLDSGGVPKTVRLGNYNLEARFSFRSFGGVANTLPDRVAALFISTGPDDYIIMARGMNVYFNAATNPSDSVGLATVEGGVYAGGKWVPGRRLNGDETPEWKALRFRSDAYTIQHVKLYRYK
jgi:beta-galactosidase GanA